MNENKLDSAKLSFNSIYTGIVVERETDPQSLGRIKVEVIGLHDGDTKVEPEDLPWAWVLAAGNNPNTFSSIKEGEWVSLYFLDEGVYKYPVVIGVIPGLNPNTTRVTTLPPLVDEPLPLAGGTPTTTLPRITVTTPVVQTVDLTTPAGALLIGAPGAPAPSSVVNNGGTSNTGSNPLISRLTINGVRQTQNDIIGIMDSFREHVCGVTTAIATRIAQIRESVEQFISDIINRIIASVLGQPSPIVQSILDAVSWVQARIRFVRKLFRTVQETIFYVLQLIREIQQLVEFILSLPERLLAIFAKCLTDAIAEFGRLVQFAAQVVTDPLAVADRFLDQLLSQITTDEFPETETETALLGSISNFNQQLIGPPPTPPGIP